MLLHRPFYPLELTILTRTALLMEHVGFHLRCLPQFFQGRTVYTIRRPSVLVLFFLWLLTSSPFLPWRVAGLNELYDLFDRLSSVPCCNDFAVDHGLSFWLYTLIFFFYDSVFWTPSSLRFSCMKAAPFREKKKLREVFSVSSDTCPSPMQLVDVVPRNHTSFFPANSEDNSSPPLWVTLLVW